ncbi:uncharacterized protein BO66DRAFT_91606 [Aspergillus aculeatinus CBS 121060]|uniref:Uncharacterized protein n=1 Tax=Aspergillus aculeatinus CBS 121060 TaxID=1448322 RepID=A0ACD1HA02_9EURO|nr:hypothetical protein BO66DRAFT_91606 [Aspergillus aculeatinus CBS 121060]RAH70210.1 hypothetical protein BO66DRAFT_91606 [Aspergillus aculeatinus CBS 121060]
MTTAGSNELCSLQLGDLSSAELRWWAAILAGGRGWHATLNRDEKEYFSPWECHLADNCFTLLHSRTRSPIPSDLTPPSSVEAQAYLVSFARSHGCLDQLLAAFAAAITLPSHLRFGAPITLPKPVQGPSERASQKIERF